jgi:hypothetical protein
VSRRINSHKPGDSVFVAKIDPSGRFLWAIPLPADRHPNMPTPVQVDSEGEIYLAGAFRGSVDFGGTALAARGEPS